MNDILKLNLDGFSFTWDDKKEAANIRKHGVSFKLAAEVFSDENAVSRYDELHSFNEERWQIIGATKDRSGCAYRILFVVYVERVDDDDVELYRIISARDANEKEVDLYGMGLSWKLSADERGSNGTRNVRSRRGH